IFGGCCMSTRVQTIQQLTIPTPFPVGEVHMYLLKGDTLSLVDAGVKTPDAWGTLQLQLKEKGYQPRDVEQIILTHHHPDHTGLIEQFPRVDSIVAHPNVDVWLRKDEGFFQWYETFFKTSFTRWGVPKQYVAL